MVGPARGRQEKRPKAGGFQCSFEEEFGLLLPMKSTLDEIGLSLLCVTVLEVPAKVRFEPFLKTDALKQLFQRNPLVTSVQPAQDAENDGV